MDNLTVKVKSSYFDKRGNCGAAGESAPTPVPIIEGPVYVISGEVLEPSAEEILDSGMTIIQGDFKQRALIIEHTFTGSDAKGVNGLVSRLMTYGFHGKNLHDGAYRMSEWAKSRGFENMRIVSGKNTENIDVYCGLEDLSAGDGAHLVDFIYLGLHGAGSIMSLKPEIDPVEIWHANSTIAPEKVRQILDKSSHPKMIFVDSCFAASYFGDKLPKNSIVINSCAGDEVAFNSEGPGRFLDYTFAKRAMQFAINYGTIDFKIPFFFGRETDMSKINLNWLQRREIRKQAKAKDPNQRVQTLNVQANANIIMH